MSDANDDETTPLLASSSVSALEALAYVESVSPEASVSSISSVAAPPDAASADTDAAAAMAASLDDAQRAVLDAVIDRRENVFVTGSAGTGKSYTLRALVHALRARDQRVAVVSSTGISATNLHLNATTLHAFAGFGDTGMRAVSAYVRRLRSRKMERVAKRMQEIDVLVLDEISMTHAELLGTLEALVATVRGRPDERWGGLVVVYAGDFMQLRPVPSRKRERSGAWTSVPTALAFTAERAWREADVHVHELALAHRQAGDVRFAELLARARFGRLTEDDVRLLRTRVVPLCDLPADVRERATFLFARNLDVDTFNTARMRECEGERHMYLATLSVRVREPLAPGRVRADVVRGARTTVLGSMRAPERLELCIGARVMLLANVAVSRGLANGSKGTVTGFTADGAPLVTFDVRPDTPEVVKPHPFACDADAEYSATYKQLPLALSWALTVHKSQGMTLRCVVVAITRRTCFVGGMAFMAMSRATGLAELFLPAFEPTAVYADAEATAFYEKQ